MECLYQGFSLQQVYISSLLRKFYFAYKKTPIYEVKSYFELGYIGKEKIEDIDSLEQKLKVIFSVEDMKFEADSFEKGIDILKNQTIENINREINLLKTQEVPSLKTHKEDKINIEFQTRISQLNEKMDIQNFKKSGQNLANTKLVGEYIINDFPIKPKKSLIIIVAFVSGFILSIFLVFFLQFIRRD